MPSIERLSPTHRALLLGGLCCIFVGLFVWHGTIEPNPTDNNYPDSTEIAEDPDRYLGAQVSVSGTVVAHDPLRIETEPGLNGTLILAISNVDDPPPVGHTLRVFGTLTATDVVRAETTVSRTPWEATYMYVVSFIGGLWVLGRLLIYWRLDRDTYSILRRGESDA